jgi:transcriptional regulator with XRE-family HTH domain
MKRTHGSKRRNVTGKRIRRARLAAKPPVSQEDLSGRLAVLGVILDQGAISRVEREERYLMDYELLAIARALRIKPSSLVD